MRNGDWTARAAKILPADSRRDLFEPAREDLRATHLARRAGAGPLWRALFDAWYAIRVILLILECVRLEGIREVRPPADRRGRSDSKEELAMFLYHLRHAFRLLVREPGFTLAAVLTLAIGVGANVAVFAVVEAVLLRPLPYPAADRLVLMQHRDRRTGITKGFIAIGDFVDVAQRQKTFEGLSSYGGLRRTLSGIGEPLQVEGLLAGPGLLHTLGVRPVLGRDLTAEDSRPKAAPVMLLSYELWQSVFGSDPHIVGRGVKLDREETQVVGVAPPGFRFPPNAQTKVILPMTVPVQAPSDRKSTWTFAVGRLKAGDSLAGAAADLTAISGQMEREFPRSNLGSEYFVLPVRDALVGSTKRALVLMFAAVGVVLTIACANVANLLLARSLARRREMAVRLALGAGRMRLAGQLLAEGFALAAVAGIAGIAIASWGARALVSLVPKSVNAPGLNDVHINGGVLAFTLGISLATALVFGLASALTVRTGSATGSLVSPGRVSMGAPARRTASALVVVEVALAIVLLIGAGLILRSSQRLLAVNPGFRTDRVLTMTIAAPRERYATVNAQRAFYDRAFAALKRLPQVEEAGAAAVTPLTGNNWTVGLERPEKPVPAGERPPEVGWQLASGGYFRALQIPLLAGRLFDQRDGPEARPAVIVSEAIERRYFPGERALGHEIKLGNKRMEIVGVVGNIRRADLRDELRADLYFPFESEPGNQITLFIRTSREPAGAAPGGVVKMVQAALREVEPNLLVFETQTMAEIALQSMQVIRLALWLLGIFAAIALVLAAVGIYGVMSYVVRQRTREIGTRVALGASSGDIVWLVMRQGGTIAAAGTAIGLAFGVIASRSLASILYGVTATDPLTLGAAAGSLFVTTMAACYLPARRASLVDPARTLAEQ